MRSVVADEITEVKGSRQKVVHKDESVQINANRWVEVVDSQSFELVADFAINVTGKCKVKKGEPGNIVLQAAHSIKLECGEASIQLWKNGLITLKGVKIQSEASGEHVVKGQPVTLN